VTNKSAIKSIKRAPAYQLAEEALRKMIMDGELQPGEMLPVEHDLADQLGVTRRAGNVIGERASNCI